MYIYINIQKYSHTQKDTNQHKHIEIYAPEEPKS